jgi:hypothetical protein
LKRICSRDLFRVNFHCYWEYSCVWLLPMFYSLDNTENKNEGLGTLGRVNAPWNNVYVCWILYSDLKVKTCLSLWKLWWCPKMRWASRIQTAFRDTSSNLNKLWLIWSFGTLSTIHWHCDIFDTSDLSQGCTNVIQNVAWNVYKIRFHVHKIRITAVTHIFKLYLQGKDLARNQQWQTLTWRGWCNKIN